MVKLKFATLVWIAPAFALFSCAAPKKAIIVEAAPKQEKPQETAATEPPVPTSQDDGFRLPEYLDLPNDGDFQATTPITPKTGGEGGAVISRPPTDPPARPKPKTPEAE